ncbi:MAG: methylenetetrahydrofolate--tRNA-(uracil(54)-C(5))-methyltransferase (FADH(2)-oxidizing) TrmFO [Candidatus Latescibacterota bacterium]
MTIVGAGLAGCEAAFQLGRRGIRVTLIEMRPQRSTGAHRTGNAAEIVCSNSFKSILPDTSSGVLKLELELLACCLLQFAKDARVDAGHALAVDRELFSAAITSSIAQHANIELVRRCQTDLDVALPAIIATGPLTAAEMAKTLQRRFSDEHLYFYDAIAPSIDADTIDSSVVFKASRYDKGTPDYYNIPLTKEEYLGMLERIRRADITNPHRVEHTKFFEACLPIEIMGQRGEDTLRYGPLKPKGLIDPATGKEPYAVIQLRNESRQGRLLGLVGFQTRMKQPEQKALIQSLPGLKEAKILRYGSIHRNMFINIPRVCTPYQNDRDEKKLFYAGQICGVEGYMECVTSGLVSALSIVASYEERPLPLFPDVSMTGALMNYIHTANRNFQPMNANMGILPAITGFTRKRRERNQALSTRAVDAMREYRRANSWLFTDERAAQGA